MRMEKRREEILNAAEQLFFTKGYNDTKVIDIMNSLGIAKGGFYYYFTSKEEVLDAIILRIVEQDVERGEAILNSPGIPVFDKLFQILLAQRPMAGEGKDKMMMQIHQAANAEMHQKTLVQAILGLVPILTRVVEQGIEEGVLRTEFPKETMEFLVASGQVIFDEGWFQWEQEDIQRKICAFIRLMELALGAESGSFDYMTEILDGQI